MKISGSASLGAPVAKVWEAFNDPAVLQRTLPGCEQLTEVGEDSYAMVVIAGVASIKGTYEGRVAITDQNPPGSFVLKASGAGGPGTVDATVQVNLTESASGGTELSYDADAVVGGVIGGVGQRMLSGVAKKMAAQFFTAVDADIRGECPAVPDGTDSEPGATTTSGATAYRSPASTASTLLAGDQRSLMVGLAIGATVALAGVALGMRAAGRAA